MNEVWDPSHRVAAETAALAGNRRRHLTVVAPAAEPAVATVRIELGAGDFDVASPDLRLYEGGRP